jgi:2-dehydropantoate 2-reductase
VRICVYGAGAIGGHLAARLVHGGAEVSLIARGAHLQAIQQNGLVVRAPDFSATSRITATDDPATLGQQDAVLVTVKAHGLPAVAHGISPLMGPQTSVVFVMNGIPWWYFHAHGGAMDGRRLPRLDPDDVIRQAVGPERTLGGVVYSACTVVSPGVIEVTNAPGRLVIGEPDHTISARVEAIAAPLNAAGFIGEVSDKIREAIWQKLMLNLPSGPLGILTQSGMREVYSDPVCADAVRTIVAEGLAIAAAMGCPIAHDAEKQIKYAQTSPHKPSIVQDLERGRPMEIEAMLAAPLDLARMVGVATPMLDLVVALAKIRGRQAGLY